MKGLVYPEGAGPGGGPWSRCNGIFSRGRSDSPVANGTAERQRQPHAPRLSDSSKPPNYPPVPGRRYIQFQTNRHSNVIRLFLEGRPGGRVVTYLAWFGKLPGFFGVQDFGAPKNP